MKKTVCLYEMFGTAIFVYVILVSGGDKLGVPFTLFILI